MGRRIGGVGVSNNGVWQKGFSMVWAKAFEAVGC